MKKKLKLKDIEDHIRTYAGDHGAIIVIAALYKKLYGLLPSFVASGFQSKAADELFEMLPNKQGEIKHKKRSKL